MTNLRNEGAIHGNFLCEMKLAGTVSGQYGKRFVKTSVDLRKLMEMIGDTAMIDQEEESNI